MAILFTWKLVSLRKVDIPNFNNVVINVRWEKIGTDSEGNAGVFQGATPFKLSALEEQNFVPFENLTEETVIGWIQSAVTGEYEDFVNTSIYKQLSDKRNPGVESSVMPWSDNTISIF